MKAEKFKYITFCKNHWKKKRIWKVSISYLSNKISWENKNCKTQIRSITTYILKLTHSLLFWFILFEKDEWTYLDFFSRKDYYFNWEWFSAHNYHNASLLSVWPNWYCTSPKITFWVQIGNFLSIWVYEYLLYLMIFNFWEFFIKINVIWKFMLILLFSWNWVIFFVKLPIFLCGFIIFWWNWNSKFVTQSKWVFGVQLLSYNFTRKWKSHIKRWGISWKNNSIPWK